MDHICIAERIRSFRIAHGMTQEEFGARVGVTAQAVSKWERGTCYPDITFLPRLAAAMGCTVNDFFKRNT